MWVCLIFFFFFLGGGRGDSVQFSLAWLGLVWFGFLVCGGFFKLWSGLFWVWFGLAWLGLVWLFCSGLVWFGAVWGGVGGWSNCSLVGWLSGWRQPFLHFNP